MRRKMAFGE